MTGRVLDLLGAEPGRIALFEAVEAAVLSCGACELTVSATQLAWGNPLKFAFVSLPRRVAQRRGGGLTVSFGLGRRLEHPRIAQAAEPYPGRWTHHVPLTAPEEVDAPLRAWLAEAYAFALLKQKRR